MPKLYTVRMLAELFDRHPNTIYQWFEEGLFPHAFKIKGGWYAPECDVSALITPPAAAPPPPPARRSIVKKKGFVRGWKE